jgi:P27 family predicted phage terminase small subunit
MPKTAEQERLEGYPGHRPVNENPPTPDRNIPNPPKWLGKIAARHYHDLVRRIGPEGMRVMAASDRDALAIVCDVFEKYRNCREFLEKNGRYFDIWDEETKTLVGSKRNPRVIDEQKYWGLYMTGLGQFGLTPYQRKNVSVLPEEKKESREDRIAARRKNIVEMAKQKAVND